MSRRLIAVACSAACLLVTTMASAHPEHGAEALNGMVGNWRCQPSDAQNADNLAIISTERMPGDWFVSWVVAFNKGESAKKVVKVRYDSARNRYMLFLFTEDGGYGYGVADSIQNDSLSFKGEFFSADGKDVKFTKTFQKADNGFTVSWQADGSSETTTLACQK